MSQCERHILGLMANRLFGSILNEQHPAVQNLAAWGYVERSIDGLMVTERGLTALGTTWTDGTRAMDTGRAGR